MPNAPTPGNANRRFGLAFKLALFILSGTVCIFTAGFVYNYYYSKQIILSLASDQAKHITSSALNRIESVLKEAEQVPTFLAYTYEAHLPDERLLNREVHDFVASCPSVFGSTVAFEPYGYDARLKRMAPYAFREGGDIKVVKLGAEGYDYFIMDWYLLPKLLNMAVWSEPYYDEGGGNVIMSTYSVPFQRELAGAKVFAGVITADISLEWLHKFVSGIKVYETGSAFLISRDGVFVSTPNTQLIMRESIFSIAEELGSPGIRDLGKDMIAGKEGFVSVPSVLFGKPCRLYYAPMASTGWSLGLVIPESELFAELSGLSQRVLIICGLGLFLLLLVTVGISLSVIRPIKLLASKTNEIAKGNLDVALPENRSNDEVGDLTRSFDDMRVALKEYITNLTETTKAKERMESELKIARNIQMSFLPKRFPPFPDIEAFTLHAALEPAWEVGGDLYDFFMMDDRHLFFSVGDVSGKGVPAALFMAVSKTLVKGIAEQDMDPATILDKVNQELYVDNEAMLFVTMFCGILDITTGELVFSNAGHNPPAIVPSKGNPYWLKLPPGLFLGIMDDATYVSDRITLQPGDKIMVFTDGVTEAMNEKDELYSNERLLQLLTEHSCEPPEQLDATIMSSVHSFAGTAPQADDITVLTLEFKG